MVVVDVRGKTNEVMAPSKKSNSNVKGCLGVGRIKGYSVTVQMKTKNLDHTALMIT